MDHTLLTTGQFDYALQQQHEFIRTGFNITVDSEIGIMENQVILYNILCSFRWILITHMVMLFAIAMILAYVTHLLEKLAEKDNEIPVNTYVELKDPV